MESFYPYGYFTEREPLVAPRDRHKFLLVYVVASPTCPNCTCLLQSAYDEKEGRAFAGGGHLAGMNSMIILFINIPLFRFFARSASIPH